MPQRCLQPIASLVYLRLCFYLEKETVLNVLHHRYAFGEQFCCQMGRWESLEIHVENGY